MIDPRSIAGFLEIHLEIQKVHNNLNMSLWLHVTTHDAKADQWFAVFCDKSRDYCMKRPFPGCIHIIMTFLQREHFTPVLEYETKAGGAHARPHSPVIALDERDHVAEFVCNSQIYSITSFNFARIKD